MVPNPSQLRLRGQFLGFGAAFGGAGAAIRTQVFTPIQNPFSDEFEGTYAVLLICAAFSFVGGIIAWVFTPDDKHTLERENAEFWEYCAANGDSGAFGESLEDEVKLTALKP